MAAFQFHRIRLRKRWSLVLVITLLSVGGGWVYGYRLIQQAADRLTTARRYTLGPEASQIMAQPELSGLKLTPFSVHTGDGLKLRALIAEPGTSSAAVAALESKRAELRRCFPALPDAPPGTCRGTVLMRHGINSREEHMLWHARWLVAAGFRCAAWDSRGHGESDEASVTFGRREVNDARRVLAAARGLLTEHADAPVYAYSHSMGAAILLQWLASEPSISAAVAVAPFAELSAVMEKQAADRAGGLLKALVPLVRREVVTRAGFDPAEISPLRTAGLIRCPVFFIHGERDSVIPPAQSAQLLAACTVPGSCRKVTTGAHGDALTAGGTQLQAEVIEFFLEHSSRPQ